MTDSQHSYHVAIELNNCGVLMMQLDCIEDAAKVFSQAIEAMMEAINLSQSHGIYPRIVELGPLTRDKRIAEAIMKLDECYSAKVASSGSSSQFQASPRPSDTTFMYRSPVRLAPPKVLENPAESTDKSFIILYNLAIAHHLIGLKKSSTNTLEKALNLYGMAQDLLISGQGSFPAASPLIARVVMAILNNMGHIHYELGRYEEATTFVNELSRTMFSLGADYMEEGELDDFLLTVMFMSEPPVAAAA
eukprot:CAMPEP_0118684682 /NCGR_PEP_ID=MMETSP0800-20121206/6791_1 /TAXON_ID=210618 ORGANISM="Striatella unipunctata, Strain CCMP2910" /NCGR_SAMPLE_ID=MMETSP0800 /ASSEMBLY_ACC=CAM_ASM_000638 /LENGTH=247 /DNA_ID=CAMNT_0006581439 /DNA_START=26 /DNA_END=769 /DNA_ORIENTATION=+